jgi:hypothetical protein
MFHADERHAAHGEIAWSWRPDAGVKLVVPSLTKRAGDGGYQARYTEESAYKP